MAVYIADKDVIVEYNQCAAVFP